MEISMGSAQHSDIWAWPCKGFIKCSISSCCNGNWRGCKIGIIYKL